MNQLFQIGLAIAVVFSPLLLTAVAIVFFHRGSASRIYANHRLPVKYHILAFIGLGLIVGFIGYRCGLVYFCAANPEPQFNCGLSAMLFASPIAFSAFACLYLLVFALTRRPRA